MANDSFLDSFLKLLQAVGPLAQTASERMTAPDSALSTLNALKSGQMDPAALAQLQKQMGIAPKETSDPFVWMGKRFNPRASMVSTDKKTLAQQEKISGQVNGAGGRIGLTADAVLNLPFTWSEKERDAAYRRVGEAIGQPIKSFADFNSVWKNATAVAQQSWAATQGGKKGSPLTVWDVFDLAKREGAKYGYGDGAGGSGGSGGGPVTTHSTSSSVEKLSDGSMWQVLKATATQALGRAPSNDELQRFAARANDIAVRNPTKTSTTTTTSEGGSSSHSTTQQGASAGDYQLAAENQINANPETGAYQASTTYFDALIRGLESPV